MSNNERRADADIRMTAAMMTADIQWKRDRPKQVRYLKKRKIYLQALQLAEMKTREELVFLMDRGVDPVTAHSEARAKHLLMPDEREAPRLSADWAPFGQPEPRAGRRKGR